MRNVRWWLTSASIAFAAVNAWACSSSRSSAGSGDPGSSVGSGGEQCANMGGTCACGAPCSPGYHSIGESDCPQPCAQCGACSPECWVPDSNVDCCQLQKNVDDALRAAKACDPATMPTCMATVEGACCPELVADAQSSAAQAFASAVAAIKAHPECLQCLGISCMMNPTGTCQPDGPGSTTAHCVP